MLTATLCYPISFSQQSTIALPPQAIWSR